jgi:synaptosomal-associated protein 29
MAGNKRYDNSKNPFYADEENDIDDDTFLRHSKSGSSGYMFGSNDLSREQRDLEERRLQLLERKRLIEERTVESSNRSIGLLRDSEQIGVATAEVG